VEAVVALLPGNLEADESEAFSRDNRLLTFAADDGSEFHSSPLQLALPYLTARCVALSDPYGLSVDELTQEPRTRRALQSSDSPHTRIRCTALAISSY